ncbi:site-2 protease family protein [Candidatus Saccharibacteria bacterium]|nr:site-2 protease family protein [Candidatus Saccharibacteria bacterium]
MSLVGVISVLVVIVFSMMLHELAHGGVAYLLGDTTAKDDGRLTLNPLKHLDPVMSVILPLASFLMGGVVFGGAKPVPVNTRHLKGGVWGMAAVALAGPLTNFVLAFIGFLIWEGAGAVDLNTFLGTTVVNLVFVNLGFGVFNLIPIPPLDGSRILYAIAPDGAREFMDKMEKYGIFIVYILILVGGNVFSSVMTGAMNGILQGYYWIIGR